MKTRLYPIFIALALLVGVHQTTAQGTAFTYQGQLQDGGGPASGTYNLTFSLFNTNTSGVAFIGPVTTNGVMVTNGLFTVLVDFGPGAFNGTSNWMEIAVETNGNGSFTTLSPRQQLTPAPYAIYSVNAGNAATAGTATIANSATTATNASNFSGTLVGDVTGTQSATVVSSVGGQTAANVASGTVAANAATSANTVSTIVTRDASGNFSAGSVTLNGNVTLAMTTAAAGVIYANGRTLMHSYGTDNFFAGSGAGNLTLTGTDNTGVGSNSLHSITSAFDNTAFGHDSLMSNLSGADNTAVGGDALEATTTGANNTASGAGVLQSNITGGNNTASGKQVLTSNLTGSNNSAFGYQVLDKTTNSSDNTALGYQALYNNTSGGSNTVSGFQAPYNNTSGNNNIVLGYQAGYNLTTGVSNIDIGNMGMAADSNIIRLGTTQTATYLVGTVYANGVALTSDRNAKENFQPVDCQVLLTKVSSLPVTQWNYKTDSGSVQHIGPMAQDFQAAFQLNGADDRHISVVDEGGVALAAIQGLNQKLEQQSNAKDAEIQTLKQQNDSLAERLNELEATVKQVAANK